MKSFALTLTLCAAALGLAACAESSAPATANSAAPAPANNSANVKPPTNADGKNNPMLASGHGDKPAPPATNGAPPAGDGGADEAIIPKPLQEKVKAAEAKAKNGGPADKVAAAKALIERGNVFYEAGQPRLYKYALRDFRLAAKLDPTNAEASGKRDQIVQIYQSMNRPVPTLGEEP
jgi:hypothetical protein